MNVVITVDSRLWNLLSTWQKTCKLVNYLLCIGIGLSTFCLKKQNGNFLNFGAKGDLKYKKKGLKMIFYCQISQLAWDCQTCQC